MVFAPHAWSRWTALLVAACLFLLLQARLHRAVRGASLEVRSVPAGAEVRVDGNVLGRTNFLDDALTAGAVEVEVRRKGYLSAREMVQLESGKTALVTFTLEPQPVEISFKVEGPDHYKLELGPGDVREEEDAKKLLLEPGLYDLTVTGKGYKSLRKKLEVKPGTAKTLALELREEEAPAPAPTPPPRPVVVVAAPRPAPVYIPPPPRYYAPPPPRYYPPPPVYRPRPVYTPVPEGPIMTPI